MKALILLIAGCMPVVDDTQVDNSNQDDAAKAQAADPLTVGATFKSADELMTTVIATLRKYRDLGDDEKGWMEARRTFDRLDYALETTDGVSEADRKRWRGVIKRRQDKINNLVETAERKAKLAAEKDDALKDRYPTRGQSRTQSARPQDNPQGYRQQWYWQGGGYLPGGSWRGMRWAEVWGARDGVKSAQGQGNSSRARSAQSALDRDQMRDQMRDQQQMQDRQQGQQRQSGQAGQRRRDGNRPMQFPNGGNSSNFVPPWFFDGLDNLPTTGKQPTNGTPRGSSNNGFLEGGRVGGGLFGGMPTGGLRGNTRVGGNAGGNLRTGGNAGGNMQRNSSRSGASQTSRQSSGR